MSEYVTMFSLQVTTEFICNGLALARGVFINLMISMMRSKA